jgi:glycine/D-amino acid oxidase-like deaminating enzyme
MNLTSSLPFWQLKNGLTAAYPSLKESIETDVLIIGAGITGSLMAHQCIKDGYRTCIIDKRDVATGSTSATTSMLQYEIDVPLHQLIGQVGEAAGVESYRACSKAIDTLKKIAEEVSAASGFTKKKSLLYAAGKRHLSWLEKELDCRAKYGFRVNPMTGKEIQETYGIKNGYGGILSEQGGSVDAFRLSHDLLAFNIARGLQVFDRTELHEVKRRKSYNSAITTDGIEIKAQKIVYCTGYEIGEVLSKNVVKLLSSYALVSEQYPDGLAQLEDTLFWNTDNPYIYFRTTADNRFLIGGKDLPFKDPVLRDKLISKQTTGLEKYISRHLPSLKHTTDYSWAGTFGETKDGLPYIGAIEKYPDTYFVYGFGGNGITFSVAGMEMLSHWLKGEWHPLSPHFRFGR